MTDCEQKDSMTLGTFHFNFQILRFSYEYNAHFEVDSGAGLAWGFSILQKKISSVKSLFKHLNYES